MSQVNSLNIQILSMIFTTILMITIQKEKEKFLIVFDNMIVDIKP